MQMFQERIESLFLEIKGEVKYYYCSAFLISYIYDILQAEVFCNG